MTARRPAPRRGFVLIAVLLIVSSALLMVTTILFMAQADAAGAASTRERAQSRLLVWSGIQIVSERLDGQRDRILEGDQPELDDEYVIYEDGSRQGVVRLLPVTASGGRLAPEAARLDLNSVTAPALAATGLLEETLAERIISYRDATLGGSFQSVAELLHVPGVTSDLLYGPLEDITLMDDAAGDESDLGARVASRLEDEAPRGLADVVTVYGFEPALQRSGDLRINVNVPWSEELGRRVERRFGEDAARVLEQIMDRGTALDSDAAIFRVMRSSGAEPEEWPDIIDALTTDADGRHFGRLDINTAPYETLVALDGIEPEQANQIVRARDSLGSDRRATVAWPAIEGIVPPEAYDRLAGRITTRSWTYRLRLAAGERNADDADGGALENPVIYEVVIDLGDPRPRVAYLRDVTLLQIGASLIAARFEAAEAGDELLDADPGLDRTARDDDGAARAAGAEDRTMPDRATPPRATRGAAAPGPPNGAPEDGANTPSGPTLEEGRAPMGPGVRRERVGRWRSGRAGLGSSGSSG